MNNNTAAGRGREVGGQLVGAFISAAFGALWAVGCAVILARVQPAVGIGVGVIGVIIGVILIIDAFRQRAALNRAGHPSPPNAMFASRGYRIVVAIEVVAIVASGPVLGRLGLGDYVVIWVAFVVGAHFLGFGRLFWRGFYLIGAVMIIGVVIALVVALSLSTVAAGVIVTAVCGVDLLISAWLALRDARARA